MFNPYYGNNFNQGYGVTYNPTYGNGGMQQPPQANNYGNYYSQPQPQNPTQYQRPQEQTQTFKTMQSLQGKSVDSIDVVKAMDIPLDGSISYFPITDGSAIVTKQLQPDGTSKTIVYKQTDNTETPTPDNYVTVERFEKELKNIETPDFDSEITGIKRKVENLQEDIDI